MEEMTMRMSIRLAFAAGALALVPLTLPAAAQTKVTIGYPTASDFLPAFIAKEEGCFDKHKIDATMTRIPIVSNIPAALVAGSLQIGMSTPTVMLQTREGGLDLVGIAGATRMVKANPSMSLVMRKGVDVKTAADVKGKKIGVPGLNSVADVMFKKWLKNNGVKPEEVTFIEATFPQMPDLLKGGTLDGVVAVEPIRSRIVGADIGYRIPEEFYVAVNPDSLLTLWSATGAWAKANPEVIKNFRACLAEGLASLKANPEKAKEIEKKYLGFTTPVYPTMALDLKADDFVFFVDLAKEMGLIRKDVDVKTLVVP
jgi:NitT/TauT family transport system substrate-binding protein